jgi:hypothetical protein
VFDRNRLLRRPAAAGAVVSSGGGDGAVQQLGATDAVGAGAQRGVCGLGRRAAHAGAWLLEPPWVRGWYQNVRLLEAVILGVERPLRGAASSQVTACRRFAPPRLRRGLWG